jgi:hypothetical protein
MGTKTPRRRRLSSNNPLKDKPSLPRPPLRISRDKGLGIFESSGSLSCKSADTKVEAHQSLAGLFSVDGIPIFRQVVMKYI